MKRETARDARGKPACQRTDGVVRNREDQYIARDAKPVVQSESFGARELPGERTGGGRVPGDEDDRASRSGPGARERAAGASRSDKDDAGLRDVRGHAGSLRRFPAEPLRASGVLAP